MIQSKVLTVNGEYNVSALDINLAANTIRINGNLIVDGTRTEVNSTDSFLYDNVITLNKGEAGAGVTGRAGSPGLSGIEVDRGLLEKAVLRWNEEKQAWELGLNGSASEILTLDSDLFLREVEDDPSPKLGGNLNVSNRSIYSDAETDIVIQASAGHSVALSSPLLINDQHTENPNNDSTAVYAAPSAGGGTGLYISRESTNEELVSKKKAVAFSIIF